MFIKIFLIITIFLLLVYLIAKWKLYSQ
jgi:hypothetical protein